MLDYSLFSLFDVFLHQIRTRWTRQSISLTKPNDDWLKEQIASQEYSSKSELINDLIRQARNQQIKIDWISAKLEKAEKSGFTKETREESWNDPSCY